MWFLWFSICIFITKNIYCLCKKKSLNSLKVPILYLEKLIKNSFPPNHSMDFDSITGELECMSD